MTAVANYFKDSRTANPNSRRLLWGFIGGHGAFITNPPFQFDQVQAFSHSTASWSWSGTLARGSNVFTIVASDGSPAKSQTTEKITIKKP
jgi:hypothetical protein